jgi:hypothetical protein
MHNLGLTRSDRQLTHLLQTLDAFVGMPLPGFDYVTVIGHAAPAIGAAFTQYTAEFEPGGSLGPAHGQRFLYPELRLSQPLRSPATNFGAATNPPKFGADVERPAPEAWMSRPAVFADAGSQRRSPGAAMRWYGVCGV